jgi:hypothetical protein
MERATDTSATLLLLLWHRLVSSLTLGHDSAFLLRAVFTFDSTYRTSVVASQTMNLFFFHSTILSRSCWGYRVERKLIPRRASRSTKENYADGLDLQPVIDAATGSTRPSYISASSPRSASGEDSVPLPPIIFQSWSLILAISFTFS